MHLYFNNFRSAYGTKRVSGATAAVNRSRQRGSQTIEGALITLIMFGLIFLIFDIATQIVIRLSR